ncbi:hypothetical protein BKA69DRAFT_584063 [Paraphysoderma sedebokerense]|nr:hypothetical protein BKA69DRAFT_584063 [Paraphysoderma sedebokerense]
MRNATSSNPTFNEGGYNQTTDDKRYNETWLPYLLAQVGLNSSETLSGWLSQSELIIRNFTYNILKFFNEWGLTIVVITTVYICLLIVKLFLGYALLDAACSRYQRTVNQDMIIRSRRPSVVSPSSNSAPGTVSSSPIETRDSEQRLQTQNFYSIPQMQEKESKYVKGKERESFIRRRRTASGTGVKLSQLRRRSTSAIEQFSGITKNEFKTKLEEQVKGEHENSAPNQKVVPSWVIKHTKQIDVQLPRLPEQFQSQPPNKSQAQSGELSQKSPSISSRNSAESLIPIGQDEQDKKILASLENIDRFSLVKNRIP